MFFSDIIEIIDDSPEVFKGFIMDEIAIKITTRDTLKQEKIVMQWSDLKKLLGDHLYNPILSLATIPLKIAYLCGCLNYEQAVSHGEDYVVWWRKINTDDWNGWFIIKKSDQY